MRSQLRNAVLVITILALFGCSGQQESRAPHHTRAPTTTGRIASAAAADCASYRAVRATINAATAGDSTAGQLVTTIAGGGANVADTWTSGLTSAAKRNDAAIPAGRNAATQLGFKMSYVALGIGQTQVDADAGNAPGVKRDWGLVTGGMSALDRACRSY